jgi:hypothetical protein
MERKSTRFRARVIRVSSMNDKTGHTGNRHHVTAVLLDHRRQELLNHEEVRDGVDFESLPDDVL